MASIALTLPTACTPDQLTQNLFTNYAYLPTVYAALSIFWLLYIAVGYPLSARFFPQRVAWNPVVARILAIVTLIFTCALVGMSGWFWLQAHNFIPFCEASPSVSSAQHQQNNVLYTVSLLNDLIYIVLQMGMMAATLVFIIMNARVQQSRQPQYWYPR